MKRKVVSYVLLLVLLVQSFSAGWVGMVSVQAATSLFEADITYYITEVEEEKTISLIWDGQHGSSMQLGAEQGLYDYYSGWNFVYDSSKSAYKIVLATSESTLLGVRIDSCTSYVSIVTYSTSPTSSSYNSSNKYWLITENADGTYSLSPKLYPNQVLVVVNDTLELRSSNTVLPHKWRISARNISWFYYDWTAENTNTEELMQAGYLNSINSWNSLHYTSYNEEIPLIKMSITEREDGIAMINNKNMEIVFIDTHCRSEQQQITFGVQEVSGGGTIKSSITTDSASANGIQNFVEKNGWKHIKLIVFAACGTGRDTSYPSIAKTANTYCGAQCSIGFEGELEDGTQSSYFVYSPDAGLWEKHFSSSCAYYNIEDASTIAVDLANSDMYEENQREINLYPIIFGDGSQYLKN